jgi:hypothetical protein
VLVERDEGIRPTKKEDIAKLKTLKAGGRITAAVASQVRTSFLQPAANVKALIGWRWCRLPMAPLPCSSATRTA